MDYLDADLDAFLDGDLPPDIDGDPPELDVAAVGQADRVLGRVRRLKAKLAEVNALYDERVTELRRWRDDRTAGLTRQEAWAERQLEAWMRSQYAATKTVTVKLPSGELKLRGQQPITDVVDPDLAAAWLEQNGYDAVVTKWEPNIDKAALKKAMKEDGLTIPGVVVTERPEKRFDLSAG